MEEINGPSNLSSVYRPESTNFSRVFYCTCPIVAMLSLASVGAASADIAGKVQGANRPISGSTVTLYATGAGAPVQLAQSKADDNGAFKLNASRCT
jgi:hypothetical protein